MPESLPVLDLLFFVVMPYAAVIVAIAGTIERYRAHALSVSSHSSQFLENRQHFWGEVPFHYGILLVLAGHVILVLLPASVRALSGAWLFAVEAAGIALGLLAAFGLVVIVARRLFTSSVRVVTSRMDWVVYGLLLVQIASGLAVAVIHPWGSSWFATVLTPYLWSLASLQPDAAVLAAMPLVVKLHVVTAWTLVAVFPFSRLVHAVAAPLSYLWRPPQVVRWRRFHAAPMEKRP